MRDLHSGIARDTGAIKSLIAGYASVPKKRYNGRNDPEPRSVPRIKNGARGAVSFTCRSVIAPWRSGSGMTLDAD